eukprot:scaffold34218_cov59-Phaeocystis_antarctica.AAC.2
MGRQATSNSTEWLAATRRSLHSDPGTSSRTQRCRCCYRARTVPVRLVALRWRPRPPQSAGLGSLGHRAGGSRSWWAVGGEGLMMRGRVGWAARADRQEEAGWRVVVRG